MKNQIEKQAIEEMAHIVSNSIMTWANEMPPISNPHFVVTNLYNAGYLKQEWISVEERLPEDGVWVLGYSAKSGRGGLCNCLKSYVREFGNYDDTTHWLQLPEFPKKKGE